MWKWSEWNLKIGKWELVKLTWTDAPISSSIHISIVPLLFMGVNPHDVELWFPMFLHCIGTTMSPGDSPLQKVTIQVIEIDGDVGWGTATVLVPVLHHMEFPHFHISMSRNQETCALIPSSQLSHVVYREKQCTHWVLWTVVCFWLCFVLFQPLLPWGGGGKLGNYWVSYHINTETELSAPFWSFWSNDCINHFWCSGSFIGVKLI